MFNKPSPRPPSSRQFHQLAQEIRTGGVRTCWDLWDLCQTNKFYEKQLLDLLNEPARQAKLAKQKQEETARKAHLERIGLVKSTCLQRRAYLSDRERLHRNTYPEFLQYQKEQAEQLRLDQAQQEIDQKKWMRFVISVYEYRTLQASAWVSREDLPAITQLIWETSPYSVSPSGWPVVSKCPVDPQPYVPENHAEIFSTKHIAENRAKDEAIYYGRVETWMKTNMDKLTP